MAGPVAGGRRYPAAERTPGLGAARFAIGCSIAHADPEPPLTPRPHFLRHLLYAVLGLIAIGAVLMRTQLAQMDGVPDLGDPLFSMWRMGWVFHQLGGDPRPLFDANIFHPEPLTFTYSDSMLLPAAIGAPLLAIGLSPAVAYNLLFLSGFLLSGIDDLRAIERAPRLAAGGVRRRVDLRVLPVSLRALQPSRAADDLLDAAGVAGAAPPVADVAHALRRRARVVRRGGALLVDVLRRVLPALRAVRSSATLLLVSASRVAPHRAARSPPPG